MVGIQFNKEDVVIVGASGLARELESWINLSVDSAKWNVVGFLDDNLDALNNYDISIPIIGKIDFIYFNKNHYILIAIADCLIKENIYNSALRNNIKVASFFHDTARVGARTILGEGVMLFPYAIISSDSVVGNSVFINNGSQIGHDVKIGDFTSIMANVDIGGGAVIGNNVFIGSNAVILPGVKIPDNTRIGAGSVVIKSIKQAGTYFGNPAKKIF